MSRLQRIEAELQLGKNISKDDIKWLVKEIKRNNKEQEMKFFEVNEEYYCLIMAQTREEALPIYVENMDEDATEETFEEISEEVDRDYAVNSYLSVMREENKEMKDNEILENIKDNEPKILIIDGSLL